MINEVVKASIGKKETIDVNKIFDDIKQKALKHYQNDNIKDLATQLNTSISDIKEYSRVLDLITFLKLFSELKSNIKNGKDYTNCIVKPEGTKLDVIQLKDVKYGTIKIRGYAKFIHLQYPGSSRDWLIRRAYGLSYPLAGEFLNTTNKFCLILEFDSAKNVWRTSEIKLFKKIKYIQPYELKEVIDVLYDNKHLRQNMQNINKISKYIDESIPDTYKNREDAAKAVVKKIIDKNKQRQQEKKKTLTESDFYAKFGINAWKDVNREMLERDLRAFLEPIGIELDKEVFD